jgi:hypothetical protein
MQTSRLHPKWLSGVMVSGLVALAAEAVPGFEESLGVADAELGSSDGGRKPGLA